MVDLIRLLLNMLVIRLSNYMYRHMYPQLATPLYIVKFIKMKSTLSPLKSISLEVKRDIVNFIVFHPWVFVKKPRNGFPVINRILVDVVTWSLKKVSTILTIKAPRAILGDRQMRNRRITSTRRRISSAPFYIQPKFLLELGDD